MSSEIPVFYPMTLYRKPSTIVLLGCGGTGGHVAGSLARLVGVTNSASMVNTRLVFVDGDTVEEKNLSRQHFAKGDLGRNKAEVAAARYSAALGIQIEAVSEYLEDDKHLLDIIGSGGYINATSIVIGCVDNNASRLMVNKYFSDCINQGAIFWIDAGNEEESGQVVCGYRPPASAWNTERSHFSMPSVVELYPSIAEGDLRFNSQLSCAELAQSSPQNMMANVTAATIVLNFIMKIAHRKPLACHGVSFSIDNAFRTMLNTGEALDKVDKERRRPWETPLWEQDVKKSAPEKKAKKAKSRTRR